MVSEDPGAQRTASDPSVPLTERQQVAVYRMNELLYRQMPRRLTLAAREVYPSYRSAGQWGSVNPGKLPCLKNLSCLKTPSDI